MNYPTPRQRGLLLIAKLYELAADFSDEELDAIYKDQVKRSQNSGVLAAIKSLSDINAENHQPASTVNRVRVNLDYGSSGLKSTKLSSLDNGDSENIRPIPTHNRGRVNLEHGFGGSKTAELSSLAELLADRRSFPSVADISRLVGIEARAKESRDRYILRVLKKIQGLPAGDRAELFNKIAREMKSKSGSFISNWSKLIKEM